MSGPTGERRLKDMTDDELLAEEDRLLLLRELDWRRRSRDASGRLTVVVLSAILCGVLVALTLALVGNHVSGPLSILWAVAVLFGGSNAAGALWKGGDPPSMRAVRTRHAFRTLVHHWPAVLVVMAWLWGLGHR